MIWPTTTLFCTTTETITGSGETLPVGSCVVYATCTTTFTATYAGTLPILIPPGECVVNAQTAVACTNTITITLTAGQPPPPLAVPLPGSCYAFVTVSSSTASYASTAACVSYATYTCNNVVGTYCSCFNNGMCSGPPPCVPPVSSTTTSSCPFGAPNCPISVASSTATSAVQPPLGSPVCPTNWPDCVATNPVVSAVQKFWNWLRCLFGYCA
jgi:hypothetical protein